MELNNIDRDVLLRLRTLILFIKEHALDILDLKVQMDADPSGLKARMLAEPDDGLSALASMGWDTLTPTEFFDMAYLVTAVLGDGVNNGLTALAASHKLRG